MTTYSEQVRSKPITVVCAYVNGPGEAQVLLATRRAPGVEGLDGKWELPGGKIEHGETPEAAVVREIYEEIGIRVRPLRMLPYLHTNIWTYPETIKHVILACYECELVDEYANVRLPPNVKWHRIANIDYSTTLPGTREFVALASEHEFDRVFMRFECIRASKKSYKEYTIATQPTLFSQFALVKYWGPLGNQGRMAIVEFDSASKLDEEIIKTAKKRFSHGYRLAQFQGPDQPYKPLLRVIEMAKRRGAFAEKEQSPALS